MMDIKVSGKYLLCLNDKAQSALASAKPQPSLAVVHGS